MGFFQRLFGIQEKSGDNIVPDNQITTSEDLYEQYYGYDTYFRELSPLTAYRLYTRSSILGIAVNRVAVAVANLRLGITTDGQDFDADAAVIEFLNQYSEGETKRQFLAELAISFLLTNEAWIVWRGRVNNPPVGRAWVYPFDINTGSEESTGFPAQIRTTGNRDNRTYRRVYDRGRIRYIDDRELNELVPIIGKRSIRGSFRGLSPVGQLLYDVQQGTEGKRNNTALLQNGIRNSAVISPQDGETFDKKAMDDIAAAIRSKSGAGYAGGTLVMPRPFTSSDLGTSNREMDFVNLLEESQQAVLNWYGVPLPLYFNDAATFNNYKTAQTGFYDNAVFPVFEAMGEQILQSLLPRFPEVAGKDITFNENTVRALTDRNIERMAEMRKTQALSTNEIRESGGYKPIDEGEEVLVPAALVSLGEEPMPEGGMNPFDDIEEEEEEMVAEDAEQG